MTRPNPILVQLADGTSRKMYETNDVDILIAEMALKIDKLERTFAEWKRHITAP